MTSYGEGGVGEENMGIRGLNDGYPGVVRLASNFMITDPGGVAPSIELESFR